MTLHVVWPEEGRAVMDRFVVFKLFSADAGGALSIVEHNLQPETLGAPLHTHRNEDEYSYVLEGELNVLIGDELIHAPTGTLVCKPRNIPHTFWNPSKTPTRLLEIISPGGFEGYFEELAEIVGSVGPPDLGRVNALAQKYQVEMDFDSIAVLVQKYNVQLSGSRSEESATS